MPAPTKHASLSLPFLVALVAWVFPGAGYLLIKQRARGITIGITILVLFFSGLLIGGVRCLEVPGYDAHGVQVSGPSHPVDEVRAKPWTIAQIMMGPLDILCDWWSVSLAQPVDPNNPNSERIGSRSPSRVNELGILYTAVAGMLNLLAIIDSSHRASIAEAK
jgi:hypothetical protein